jgi:hypothetical protein
MDIAEHEQPDFLFKSTFGQRDSILLGNPELWGIASLTLVLNRKDGNPNARIYISRASVPKPKYIGTDIPSGYLATSQGDINAHRVH